jgi:plastocyanin
MTSLFASSAFAHHETGSTDHAMDHATMHSHGLSAPSTALAEPIAKSITANATISFVCCSYSPNTVTINAGESVTWNGDFAFHPLAQVTGPEDDTETPGGFAQSSGTTFTHTFDQPGTYYFACLFHGVFGGTMRGQVTVNATTDVPGGLEAALLKLRVTPNPTFATATASFTLPRAMNTDVSVYDLAGAHVSTLQHGFLPAGNQRLDWNGRDSAGRKAGSGIYFVLVSGENFRAKAKVVKVR